MAQDGYINNFSTTLTGTIDSDDVTATVADASALESGLQYRVKIDDEYLIVTKQDDSTLNLTTRGAENSVAASHSNGATVQFILTKESLENLLTIEQSGGSPSVQGIRKVVLDGLVTDNGGKQVTLRPNAIRNATASGSVVVNADGSIDISAATGAGANKGLTLFGQGVGGGSFGDIQWSRETDLSEVTNDGTTGCAGIYAIRYGNPSTSFASRLVGADFTAAVPVGNTQNFTGPLGLVGVIAGAAHGGSGTVNNVTGIVTDIWPIGPTNEAIHIYLGNESNVAVGTVDYYGIRIQKMSKANNNYGIVIEEVSGATSYAIWDKKGRVRIDDQVGVWGDTDSQTLLTVGAKGSFPGNGTFVQGIDAKVTGGAEATTSIIAIASNPGTAATSFTTNGVVGFFANTPTIGAGSTATSVFGIYIANQTGGISNYGIYIAGAGTYALWIDSGNSRFDGLASVWGDINQAVLLDVGSAGAFDGSGTLAIGVSSNLTAGSTVTTAAVSVYAKASTAAASFTTGTLIGLQVDVPTIGAGSAATNVYGIMVGNQTGGTNSYGVYIVGATTYALHVDSGVTKLDGSVRLVDDAGSGTLGMFGSAGTTKQTVTGSRGGNAALASLITILANHGLVTDGTTA